MLKNRALFGLSVTEDDEDCNAVVMLAESGRWAPLLPIPPDGGGCFCWFGNVVALDDKVVDRGGGGVFFVGDTTLPVVLLLFELSRGVVVVATATLLGVVSFAVEDDDAVTVEEV